MYLITVNVDGQATEKKIPQSWDDLTWSTYVEAETANKDDSQTGSTIEVLTGIPVSVFENMQPYDQRFILTQCSFFWNEQPKMSGLPHDFVEVMIETDTWQRLINAEQEFKRVHESNLPEIAAAQLVIETYTGVDITELKVSEALSYWDFFFGNSLIGRNAGKNYQVRSRMTTRKRLELRNYKGSDSLERCMPYREGMSQNLMRYYKRRPQSFTQRYGMSRTRTNTPKSSESTMSIRQRINLN